MKRPIKIFEPITDDQIKKIHSRSRETGLSNSDLYSMVAECIGIPTITALSKQEAIFLIDRLHGKSKMQRPTGPRTEDEINGDTSSLPSFYHIRDIRLMIQELEWDKEHLKNWLAKFRKVKDIRSMDRKQARTSYFILKGMVEHKRCQSRRT